MDDIDREGSSRSSRRRRWEVQSKESFDNSLAVGYESPTKIDQSDTLNSVTNDVSEENNVGAANENETSCSRSRSTIKTKSSRPKNASKSHIKNVAYSKESKNIENDFNIDPLSQKIAAIIESPYAKQHSESEEDTLKEVFSKDEINMIYKNPSASAPPFEDTPVKKGTRKKSGRRTIAPIEVPHSEISKQLSKVNEDIVDVEKQLPTLLPISGLILAPSTSFSGSISTIYCEKLNNFVLSNDDQIVSSNSSEPLEDPSRADARAVQAFLIQTGFRTFAVLIQGLLAGIVVSHCLVVLMFGERLEDVIGSLFMHTFFALIIFLSSICVISSFDRCDLAGHRVFSLKGLQFPWTPLFYLTSLILSLVMIRAEDLFANYDHFSEDAKEQKNDLFGWWRNLCIARTVFSVLGWIAVVSDPHTDILRNRISQLRKY